MTNAFKPIVPGQLPLATDVDQFRQALTGAIDVGTLSLYAPIAVPSAPNVTAGAAGAITGAYQYIVVYVTGWVQPNGAMYVQGFAPSAAASITLSAQQANVPLPTGPAGVIARIVYRTTASGSTYEFLWFQADNVVTSYTDNAADATLGTNIPTVNGNAIPATAPTTNTTGTSLTTNQAALSPMGLPGATAPTRYVGATTSGPPTSGTFKVGDFVIDQTGLVWICASGGTPGTWANNTSAQHAENNQANGNVLLALTSTYTTTTGHTGYQEVYSGAFTSSSLVRFLRMNVTMTASGNTVNGYITINGVQQTIPSTTSSVTSQLIFDLGPAGATSFSIGIYLSSSTTSQTASIQPGDVYAAARSYLVNGSP